MGIPDRFQLPPSGPGGGNPISKRGLGNGVHGAVTKNFIQPLVDRFKGTR